MSLWTAKLVTLTQKINTIACWPFVQWTMDIYGVYHSFSGNSTPKSGMNHFYRLKMAKLRHLNKHKIKVLELSTQK